ncbi:MAG: hypothetical protein U0K23_07915 [Selenomonadaceae bacterium]|nr:hypothetical protein [Selenomonadaceae bacterium]
MKKMMFLALFLIFPMLISAVCSAAENDKKEVLLVNQTPFEFISSCNETLKDSNGGQAVFPKPEMLPQASTENEKMFAVFVPLDEKNHGMILMRTNTMDKVLAINITVPNKDEFPRIASNISAAVLSTIGLNDEEMKNIFGTNNDKGVYTTWSSSSNRRITVTLWLDKVDENSSDTLFNISINATDK